MNRPNTFLYTLVLLFIAFSISSCDKEKQQSRDEQQLEQLYAKIKGLAESSTCDGTSDNQLKFTAIGASPCGGPSHYLAYSTSINVKEFESLVKRYTAMQNSYNKKWNVAGTCEIVIAPSGTKCENGKPVLVYATYN
jgi:hypothetical protein